MADIGKNIRILRTQKHMTQDALANKLFLSRQTISNYETGRSQPDIAMLLRIAEVLNVDADTILYGTPSSNAQLAAKKRTIIASLATAGLAILYHLLTQLHKAAGTFLPGLAYPLVLILRPTLLLLAGWTLMQLISALTNTRLLRIPHARLTFGLVVSAVVIYYVLVLPQCGWALRSAWEVRQLRMAGQDYSYSSSFSVTPRWDACVH